MTVTVHLILNAHIDPVWLWPWQSGADEVLATCRSACDRLDNHPDIFFSRGEAWAYEIVEQLDPPLFKRMCAYIAAGRWEIVGGWYLQPDCNLPSQSGFEKQITLGRDYFQRTFGCFPSVGFNVDSFGHAALLPELMHRNGQYHYVMMRPQEHELELPARVFRWRSREAGPDITVFRIAKNYEAGAITPEYVLAATEGLPPGLTHTMCFIGVGDHGGGPTEDQIDWCKRNAQSIPGCRLEFSNLSRFFETVEAQAPQLPVVTGELQQHAIGCYSVMRAVKTGVRHAEKRLEQAACMVSHCEAGSAQRLDRAWRHVCFNHFHDTLGGTCIPSAYRQVIDQLGAAKAVADEIVQMELRRQFVTLEDCEHQRVVLSNLSDASFDGYVIVAPWMSTTWLDIAWNPSWRLYDETGKTVPYQILPPEAAMKYAYPRLLFRAQIAPSDISVFAIDRDTSTLAHEGDNADTASQSQAGRIMCAGVTVASDPKPLISLNGFNLLPRFELREDLTDTWSHGVDRFDGPVIAGDCQWEAPRMLEQGPLMAGFLQTGTIEDSHIRGEWRTYAGEDFVELLLQVHWRAHHRVLKLCFDLPTAIEGRTDGVPGMTLARPPDGREYPLRDLTMLHLAGGVAVGLVCPDVFAIDSQGTRVGLTLLRSPLMANHIPVQAVEAPRAEYADQGVHEFRFRFLAGGDLTVDRLEHLAAMYNYPLVSADFTRGMPTRRVMPSDA